MYLVGGWLVGPKTRAGIGKGEAISEIDQAQSGERKRSGRTQLERTEAASHAQDCVCTKSTDRQSDINRFGAGFDIL
jgi:hypothetical protein